MHRASPQWRAPWSATNRNRIAGALLYHGRGCGSMPRIGICWSKARNVRFSAKLKCPPCFWQGGRTRAAGASGSAGPGTSRSLGCRARPRVRDSGGAPAGRARDRAGKPSGWRCHRLPALQHPLPLGPDRGLQAASDRPAPRVPRSRGDAEAKPGGRGPGLQTRRDSPRGALARSGPPMRLTADGSSRAERRDPAPVAGDHGPHRACPEHMRPQRDGA